MTKRRASSTLYVMIMLLMITTIVFAYASVGTMTREEETRREQAAVARFAIDGATLKAAYDCGLAKVSYPSTQVEHVGSTTCYVMVTDNSSNLAHSLAMNSSTQLLGRTYTDSRVTALKMPASQFFYCLAVNSTTSLSSNITLGSGGANGDLYCSGSLTLQGNDTVNGDAEATGAATSNGATVTSTLSGNVVPITLPTPVASNYSAVAMLNLLNILFGNVVNGQTFLIPYSVVYCDGDTKISGTFAGKGIVFVNGNVTVTGNMTYLTSTDELAVIATGNVTIKNSSTSLVGYWDCGGAFSTTSNSTLMRGCIVANSLSSSGSFDATYDPTIWTKPGEAANMKLPGFWP